MRLVAWNDTGRCAPIKIDYLLGNLPINLALITSIASESH